MHEGMEAKIGREIGKVHMGSINRRYVVAQHFLRVQLNIDVTHPFPPGFLYDRENESALWIQFKLNDYWVFALSVKF